MPISIQDLPNELIGNIFRAGAALEDESHFPLKISLVNKLFRDVAHGTPDLWSHIIVGGAYSASYLSLWVQRSRSCLLDITISAILGLDASQALLGSCSRWRTLQVEGENMDLVKITLSPFEMSSFPHLEFIQIHSKTPLYRDWNTQDDIPLVNAGMVSHQHSTLLKGDLPSLTKLKLTRVCLGCTSQIITPQLTHLAISHFSPTYELLVSLFAESCLSTLVLDAFCTTDVVSPGGSLRKSIDASALNTLAVHFTDGHSSDDDCPCCLSWLSMPNLRILELAHQFDRPTLCRHFYFDPGATYPFVETLKLGITGVTEEFCAAFPNVADLHLKHHYAGSGVLKCCTQDGVWPKLKSVSVDCDAITYFLPIKDWESTLVGWVKSRRELGYPLERVSITKAMWRAASPLEFDQLRVLVEVDILNESNWFLLRWATGQEFDTDSEYEESWESDEEDEDNWSDHEMTDFYLGEGDALWDAYEDDSFDAEEDGEFEDEDDEVDGDILW